MPRKLKVAYLSYDFAEYAIRAVNGMTDECDLLLMLPEQTSRDYLPLLDPHVRFEAFHKPRLRQPFSQVWSALKIVKQVRRFRPDVVHFQNGHMYFNLAMPLIKKHPLVITIHDARQHLGDNESGHTPQWMMDFGFRRADQVIVHGRSLIDTVVGELGFDRAQVHLIPLVAIGDLQSPMPITDDRQSVLFFGRIWEYKGLEYFIKAAPRVIAEFPQAKFIIGGRGEDMQRYRQMMHDPACFEVHNNWISDAERNQMFASSSMVVLPYVEASQSGVIPLAYAHEKPVVATYIGGLPDMVDENKTGLLVPPRNAEALASAIIDLLRDRNRRMEMGRAGKRKLIDECSPSVVAKQTIDVYRKTIAARATGRVQATQEKELSRR